MFACLFDLIIPFLLHLYKSSSRSVIIIIRLIHFRSTIKQTRLEKRKRKHIWRNRYTISEKGIYILSVKLVRFPRYHARSGFLQPRKTGLPGITRHLPSTAVCFSKHLQFLDVTRVRQEFYRSRFHAFRPFSFETHGRWHNNNRNGWTLDVEFTVKPKSQSDRLIPYLSARSSKCQTPRHQRNPGWNCHRFSDIGPRVKEPVNRSDSLQFIAIIVLWIGQIRNLVGVFVVPDGYF